LPGYCHKLYQQDSSNKTNSSQFTCLNTAPNVDEKRRDEKKREKKRREKEDSKR